MKTISLFQFDNLGPRYSQYFQGAGVSCTEWDFCWVGIGSSAREAAEDALDSAAQYGFEVNEPWFNEAVAEFSDEVLDLDEDEYYHVVFYAKGS